MSQTGRPNARSGERRSLRREARCRWRVDRRILHSDGTFDRGTGWRLDVQRYHRAVSAKRAPRLYRAGHAVPSGYAKSLPARVNYLGGSEHAGGFQIAPRTALVAIYGVFL